MAALLAIARDSKPGIAGEIDGDWVEAVVPGESKDGDGDDSDLDDLVLWVEIKRQVAILREGMEEKPGDTAAGSKALPGDGC